MSETLERLVVILKAERARYDTTVEMAKELGVPYDALFALLSGGRRRSVNIEMLTILASRLPAVAALFLPADSQIRNEITADLQGAAV